MRPLAWIALALLASCSTTPVPSTPAQVAHVDDAGAPPDAWAPAEDAGALPLPPAAIERSPHVALGVPRDADPSNDLVLDKGEFVLSYDGARSVTHWVAWRLRASDLGRLKRSDRFYEDPFLPAGVRRVQPHDYARSGYDRGHLCPSADRTASHEANLTTFVMTNVQPQLHDLNAGPWEALEAWSRDQVRGGAKELYVVAGGVFDAAPQKIGAGVPVPDRSFKVIVALDPGKGPADVRPATPTVAVLMPNVHGIKERPWTDYATSIAEVERATGYRFFDKVPAAELARERVTKAP